MGGVGPIASHECGKPNPGVQALISLFLKNALGIHVFIRVGDRFHSVPLSCHAAFSSHELAIATPLFFVLDGYKKRNSPAVAKAVESRSDKRFGFGANSSIN